MKYSIFATSLIILYAHSFAGVEMVAETEFDSLAREADAVILSESQVMEIKNKNKAELVITCEILIKNRKAETYCEVVMRESEFISVDEIKAEIYSLDGRRVKKLHGRDIEEAKISPGSTLYDENRYKWFNLTHNNYPYILKYTYRYRFNTLFLWPPWTPQYDIPVRLSRYKLVIKDQVSFKTKYIGFEGEANTAIDGRKKIYTWELKYIPEKVYEDYMPPENHVQLALLFAPDEFKLGKTEGAFTSWNSMGKWYTSMTRDRYELTEETRKEIKNLIAGIEDDREKIRVLYKFLQDYTRYVAIYLDLGGWQPHTAQSIYDNKYGDCKDLTTLMIAMLNVSGIEAFPALALMRKDGVVFEDFPSNQFNHCITFIPMENDTIWLESTAKLRDIHDMPSNIQGINALVIRDGQGTICHTPVYPGINNQWISNTIIEIISGEDFYINSRIQTTGLQKKHFEFLSEYNTEKDTKIKLCKQFGAHVPNLNINSFNFNIAEKNNTKLDIKFNGVYREAVTRIGSRLMINPNFLNRETTSHIPDESIEERKFAVHINYPYRDIDTVKIAIPLFYKLEYAPDPVLVDKPFAYYKTEYSFNDDTLSYVRHLEYRTNHFELENYSEFLDFKREVVATDDQKFILKRE